MKSVLLAYCLLSTPALAQVKASYQGPEVSAPVKGASVVVVHTADSARVAYASAVRGLLAAGYGLDRQEAAVGFVSSTAKLLPSGSGVRLVVQVSVAPAANGSEVSYRGLFTWASVLAQGTPLENQQMPAVYVSGGKSPTQRAWDGLQQAAASSFPAGRLGYK